MPPTVVRAAFEFMEDKFPSNPEQNGTQVVMQPDDILQLVEYLVGKSMCPSVVMEVGSMGNCLWSASIFPCLVMMGRVSAGGTACWADFACAGRLGPPA